MKERNDPNYPVVRNLKKLIGNSGMSQNQLAVRAGMTTQRLSNILNDRGTINAREIHSLCQELDVPFNDLFRTDDAG